MWVIWESFLPLHSEKDYDWIPALLSAIWIHMSLCHFLNHLLNKMWFFARPHACLYWEWEIHSTEPFCIKPDWQSVQSIIGQQFSIKLLSVVVDPMWRSWIKQKGSRSEQLLFSEEEPPVKVLVSYCSWKFFWNDCVNVLFYLGKWLSGSMTLRFVFVFTHWLTKSVHFPSSSMIFLPARGTDFTWDLEKSVYGIVITSVEQT